MHEWECEADAGLCVGDADTHIQYWKEDNKRTHAEKEL